MTSSQISIALFVLRLKTRDVVRIIHKALGMEEDTLQGNRALVTTCVP